METEKKDEVAEAQALLEKKQQENLDAFKAEYDKLSKKYGFDFGAKPFISSDGKIGAEIGIVPVK